MRKTDTSAKLSFTGIDNICNWGAYNGVPASSDLGVVFQVVSAKRREARGGHGGDLNVLRVCGVYKAISKQTQVEKAKIKFSAL